MSTALSWTGSEYTTPDHAVSFGTAIANPSTLLTSMITNQYYFQEVGGDVDVIYVNAEGFLISAFKSMVLQKLFQSFTVRMTNTGGHNKLRWVHRNLATVYTTEQALRSCGIDIVVSDDFSGAMTTINQQLAPIWMQIYKN